MVASVATFSLSLSLSLCLRHFHRLSVFLIHFQRQKIASIFTARVVFTNSETVVRFIAFVVTDHYGGSANAIGPQCVCVRTTAFDRNFLAIGVMVLIWVKFLRQSHRSEFKVTGGNMLLMRFTNYVNLFCDLA